MHFSSSVIALLAATVLAVPTALQRRAIYNETKYDDLSISGGVAGDAQAEALAKLAGMPADLTTVEKSDLKFLNGVNQIANDAEVQAFNPAIAAATGDEAKALQNGKIKNKVLKLQATVLKLQAEIAQGNSSRQAKLDEELKKLNNNIALDKAAAGQPATKLTFDAVSPEP